MGQIRTIQHPAIESFESDYSGATEQVGGCTSLVVGFFPQGESAIAVNPTSLKSVKSYFGTPETEAERYSYYACKTVFDNGGKLIAARIPYDNNSQYLTPACKFNIEEWSTTHVTTFNSDATTSFVYNQSWVYAKEEEYATKEDFFYSNNPFITTLNVNVSRNYNGKTWENPQTKDICVINSNTKSSETTEYYSLAFNGPFFTEVTGTYMVGGVSTNLPIKSYVKKFQFASSEKTDYSSISITMSSSVFTYDDTKSFTTTDTSASIGTFGKIVAEVSNNRLTGTFNVYQSDGSGGYGTTPIATINNLIYQEGYYKEGTTWVTYITTGMKLDSRLFRDENSSYISITEHSSPSWGNSTVKPVYGTGYYSETLIPNDEKLSNFVYSATVGQPLTAFVDKLTTTTETEKVMAIKSYWKSGEGLEFPEMDSDEFLELRIWDSSKIDALSSLTTSASGYYDVIKCNYVGKSNDETTVVSQSGFKFAPSTADVTTGYISKDGIVTSELIAIKAKDVWDGNNVPEIIPVANPVGNGTINVLSKLSNNTVICTGESDLDKNDFYQFVSPYTSIRDVSLAHSNNYKWIHYTTNSALTGEGEYKGRLLMSGTMGCETSAVPESLSKIENVVSIVPDADNYGYISLSDYLDYRDDAKKVDENTIVIANITEQKFEKDSYNNSNDEISNGEEVLGIVPVLMSGFQALPRQSRVEIPDSVTNSRIFNALETIVRGSSIAAFEGESEDHVDIKSVELNKNGFVKSLGNTEEYDPYESTYSNDIISKNPSIDLNTNYKPNGAKTNYVTLVVCKLSISSANDNKVALTVLESFTGSIDSSAKDENGNSTFIDTVVNNDESGSSYVKLFSNYKTALTGYESRTAAVKKIVKPATLDTKVTMVTPKSCGVDKWWSNYKKMFTLGFTEEQTKKYISYATMVASIENVYDMLSNVDELDIDLVVDAGLSTIANRLNKLTSAGTDSSDSSHAEALSLGNYNSNGTFLGTKFIYDVFYNKIESVNDVAGWKSMAAKLITFCQTTRKDCLAIIDSPRNLCVKNNAKLIDSKKTTNSKYSIDYDILPKFNFLGGLNSSYGAGFATWLLAVDDFSGKNIWLPQSIAAEGNIIYTDYNSNYWMAPAGEKRGNVLWAVDVAFNPNSSQQDSIYSKSWNYAISSSGNIMTWGQKTFLTSNSSFNRINVRRLFLRLERLVRKNSKWVIFELNNQKTRNVHIDRIDPIFANVKAMGGIDDYQLINDTRVNTSAVVGANEYRLCCLVRPNMTAEYCVFTFFNIGQTTDFSEVYGDL